MSDEKKEVSNVVRLDDHRRQVPRPDLTADITSVRIGVSRRDMENAEALVEYMGLENKACAIAAGLNTTRWIYDLLAAGVRFQTVDPDGTVQEVVFPQKGDQ